MQRLFSLFGKDRFLRARAGHGRWQQGFYEFDTRINIYDDVDALRSVGGGPFVTLDEIQSRLEITEVLHRYARGLDRMDREMALSCWHPGGTDDHAPLYSGTAEGFVTWLWPVHAAMVTTQHTISNIIIEIEGDRAGAECYWQVTLRILHEGELWDSMGRGRYIDTFERIDGVWAIRHRQSLADWNRTEKVGLKRGDPGMPVLIRPNNPDVVPPPNARDRTDYSYTVLKRFSETGL
jgi:hypothetical protein